MTISYAITVCDELDELRRLVRVLLAHTRGKEDIVIQYDAPKAPPAVVDYLQALERSENCVRVVPFPLDGDFAAFKNNLRQHCQREYIFQIDADECPAPELLSNLQLMLANSNADVLMVARVNTVEGLTQAHVEKWHWRVDANGWVNFPDPQARIYRNRNSIRWVNRVHETLAGYQTCAQLPFVPELALIHPKTIARQEKQNLLYESLLNRR